MSKQQTVIVKKAKNLNQDDSHHMGSWKIAYADFITAMMAFFLMMWLINTVSEDKLVGLSEYFTSKEHTNNYNKTNKEGKILEIGSPETSQDSIAIESLISGTNIIGNNLQDKIHNFFKKTGLSKKDKNNFINIINGILTTKNLKSYLENIYIDVTNEGLRIQIIDSINRSVFKPNTAILQPYITKLLNALKDVLHKEQNYLSITGHTRSIISSETNSLDSWYLSATRANTIRKYLIDNNIINNYQLLKIVGKADTEPFENNNPYSIKNMRVTITILNTKSIPIHNRVLPQNFLKTTETIQ
ncbi:flagellar motor protein MotB [Rickettsia endosymbiont of Cardiosporidium cionae]|uniref:flagellar motor protein MotB n=1 Tax=Rickettsia endosymbiont of Cardiosporidium cionae TaxID=2777155 RepID=UPI0018941AC1|nr:flagellar motor protein MotB [Rickettsia endosymbiont of Cardiosporidium cionae]KAF8818498.1 Motility protein B [Rickettsia endosymbiont of Cardiosporidium cionae]